jgi:ATP-dependent DNA helicase RecG
VMKQSVNEPRSDAKASPLVGAVLIKPDGTVDTAHRGEFRQGDHAEYTLLERKHPKDQLDGSALFATLEPCSPGARKRPKMSCSERIVAARISEVWVGIEDPDPSVDRNGIKYLEQHGVTVHMFEPEFQKAIRAANRKFLVQAARRAADAKSGAPPSGSQSSWERPLAAVDMTALSETALRAFKSKLGRRVDLNGFNLLLRRQGFLAKSGRKLRPTKNGVLLFGKSPRDLLPQVGLNATIQYPDGREEIRDFDGPLILVPEEVQQWLRSKLPHLSDRSNMERKESSEVPFELVREAVINALVHRDYDILGATCHLVVTKDTIVVRSPGGPPSPVMLEQLQAFNAPMLNRNPKLQFAFTGAKLAEGRGLGMKTLGSAAEKYGLPLPKYGFDGVYLTLTIYRHALGAVMALGARVLRSLNRDDTRSWEYLSTRTVVNREEYAQHMGYDRRKAQRHLKKFVRLGLLRKVGSSSATRYEVRAL